MGDYTRDSSNRRTFLKIAALAGVSWAPFLQTNKSPADGAGSFPAKRSLPLLDPKGEVRIGLIGLTGDPGIVMNAIPDIRGARLAAFALADGEQLAEELQYLRKEKVRQSEFSEIQAYPAFHKETRLYHTYQEMLAKEELDVVASCLPSSWNAHVSMAAARQGCHV